MNPMIKTAGTIITVLPNFLIKPCGPISMHCLGSGIYNFQSACRYIQNLPYKRITSRNNLLLVLEQKQGTCSSKHALLAKLAEENMFVGITLVIGIYKMNPLNTPGIIDSFPKNLEYIPEAHAYLVYKNHRMDYTRTTGKALTNEDFLEERTCMPDEIGQKKELIHKEFLSNWCKENKQNLEEIWKIREDCIRELSTPTHDL